MTAPAAPSRYPSPPQVPEQTEPLVQALAGAWVRDKLVDVAATSPRSVQAHLGPSEIGQACQRRLAYRLTGTPIVNLPDPVLALVGSDAHAYLADNFRRLDGGSGRYLIEHPVTYRGVRGSVDLFDRHTGRCVDWKTTSKARMKQYRADGVPTNYAVQTAIYAEGLLAVGEPVREVVLAFIPRDGSLSDVWCHVAPPNRDLADTYIGRMVELQRRLADVGPDDIEATPGNGCGYCPNHRPRAADLSLACPGKDLLA